MRDADRMQEKIELALEPRQVALLAVAALVLLGVVFAAGVQVGRQITGATAAAPAPVHADDLDGIDHAHAEGAQGAAAKVAPRQPPPRAAEAVREEPEPAAPVITPLVPARAPEPAKAEAPTKAAAQEELEPDPEPDEDPAPAGSIKVAVVKPAALQPVAVVQRPSDAEVRLTPPPKGLAAFTVQVGASQDKREALRIEAKAKGAGLRPYSVEADLGAKGLWYRVRVGSFANKDVAQRYRQDVERELRVQAVVMPTK